MSGTAERNLVTSAKAGDRSAFDELVGPLVDQAFRLAFGMLHDREAAEDAVQEATVRSWRKLGNLKPGTPMRPWFLAIMANQCRTVARGRWWSVLRLRGNGSPADGSFEDRIVRAITGVPVGTVKSRINRGLAAMRQHFEPLEAVT
jgi:DNA-directed RNA polymerase specialized sigma24 family protein